jgi:hypothetical protein
VTRPIRLAILALLLVAAAVAAAVPALLPPPAVATPAPHWGADVLTVRGAYHVHSVISDGTGTIEEIAEAASAAGAQFVIITDHGDGTRVPEPPRYRSGVLCIEAVEVNTGSGHLVVLGARPSPYPLGGTASAVLEDAHRLGGMGIAAHPGSPRASLQWTDWATPVDGMEWLNADSEWRDEFLASLGRLLLTYALRPAETLTAVLDRPVSVLQRWDALTARRRVVALAGSDAHARLGFRPQTEPYEEGWHIPVPSYRASFDAFSLRVQLDAPLSGDPGRDAAQILSRIRWGRVYTVIDGLASPGAFEFTATSGGRSARMGDYLDIGGDVRLHARMAAPPGSRLVILRNGAVLFDTRDRETHIGVEAEPAVYRMEIEVPGSAGQPPIPWLVSNPIYVGMRAAHDAAREPAVRPATRRTPIATGSWSAEVSPGSSSVLELRRPVDGGETVAWDYQLAGGALASQYAAVRFPVDGVAAHDRLQLQARATQPMRAWIQLRASSPGSGERWGRTVYLDDQYRSVDVRFSEMQPLGHTSTPTPPLDKVDAVLIVVDTVNARPGSRGTLHLTELWLAAP